ncbi:MAG: hypothetical protein FVQ77_10575 [Cytophagales bacterium]|nr:hypothetical protein [Cytophagales bacterium]
MSKKKQIFITRVIGIAVFLTLLIVSALVCFTDYLLLIKLIKTNYSDIYKIRDFDKNYLTFDRFLILRSVLIGLSTLYFCCLYFIWKYADQISIFIQYTWNEFRELIRKAYQTIASLNKNQKFLLGIILAATIFHRCFYFYKFPFGIDEVFSYVFFSHQEFFVTCSYYPEPNNHIFFNMISGFFDLIIPEPMWAVRAPSLISNIILLIIIFIFVKHLFGFDPAFLSVTLLAFLFSPSYHALQGRGYMLMSLFTLISAFTLFKFTTNRKKLIYLYIFVVSSIFAAYTIPVFIIPFTGLIAYGLFIGFLEKGLNLQKKMLLSALAISLGVFIVYLPVFLISGIDAVINNSWIMPTEFTKFLKILEVESAESINYIFGVSKKGYIIAGILVIPGFYILFEKDKRLFFQKRWLILFLIFIITTLLVLLLKRSFPPYRVWTYLTFINYISVALILVWLLKKAFHNKLIYKMLFICTLISIPVIGFIQYSIKIKNDKESSAFLAALNESIEYIFNQKPTSVFIQNDECFFDFYTRLKYIEEDQNLRIDTHTPQGEVLYDFVISNTSSRPSRSYREALGIDSANYKLVFEYTHTVFQISEKVYERVKPKNLN